MTIHFTPGSLYRIVKSDYIDDYMLLDDHTEVSFSTTVFLCLRKNPTPAFPDMENFFFLCVDNHGNPHEFTMSEGSVYGDLCREIKPC
jgi:hypothetical protein